MVNIEELSPILIDKVMIINLPRNSHSRWRRLNNIILTILVTDLIHLVLTKLIDIGVGVDQVELIQTGVLDSLAETYEASTTNNIEGRDNRVIVRDSSHYLL